MRFSLSLYRTFILPRSKIGVNRLSVRRNNLFHSGSIFSFLNLAEDLARIHRCEIIHVCEYVFFKPII